MHRGVRRGLLLALLLALAGCDPGPAAQAPAPSATPALERAFQQRQAPPAGRAARLSVAAASATDCSGRTVAPGSPASLQAELPAELTICFVELAPEAALLLQVARPDGQVEHGAAWTDQQGRAQLARVVLPDDPPGAYEITARQAELTVHVSLNVARPAAPRVAVLPQAGAPGVTFRVQLAGFPAHQPVTLDLYRVEGGAASYLAPLGAVQADAAGEASYTLPSYADDPLGSYWISATLEQDRGSAGASFAIVREPPAAGSALQPRAGQSAVTLGALDLFESPAADAPRVEARPQLYRGSLVTVLRIEQEAIEVRALDDGVAGWLHAPASRLMLGQPLLGEQARFGPGARVEVIEGPQGIPLRAEPAAAAAKVRELVATGTQATLLEQRGDWLNVTLDDGATGWLRWHYAGAMYVEARGAGHGARSGE